MEDTPVTTTLNLPSIDQSMTQSQAANQFSNLTMEQKIRLLFPIWLKTHYKNRRPRKALSNYAEANA